MVAFLVTRQKSGLVFGVGGFLEQAVTVLERAVDECTCSGLQAFTF
jgi:hypothetical protein